VLFTVEFDHATDFVDKEINHIRSDRNLPFEFMIAETFVAHAGPEKSFGACLIGAEAGAHAIQYLNRLSDYLFVAARAEARRLGVDEILWRKAASISGEKS